MADTCMVGPTEVGPCGDEAPYRLEITCPACDGPHSGALCDAHAAQLRGGESVMCGCCKNAGRRTRAASLRITRTYTGEAGRGQAT